MHPTNCTTSPPSRSLRQGLWLWLTLVATLALTACGGDDAAGPGSGNNNDDFGVTVDTQVTPPTDTIPALADGEDRPLAVIEDAAGIQALFVENELWVSSFNNQQVDDFVTRWQGEIIAEADLADYGVPGVPRQVLIRVNTSAAQVDELKADLEMLVPDAVGEYKVSSQDALNLLAAGASEAADGMDVGLNWVGQGSAIRDEVTSEAPTSSTFGYTDNAFEWVSHSTGSTQDIGVAGAWRLLDLAGKMDNRVKVAILDMGFGTTNDFSDNITALSNVPWVTNPMGQSNLSDCGGPCPWHGTNVASAAMALVDDGIGGAGPAGPIAEPVLVFTYYDFFTNIVSLGMARAAGARVANMSFGARVPAILSWTVLPFNVATLAYRASGMLIFAAAGNDGADVDDEDCFIVCWESAWHTPCENGGVICVGGLEYDSVSKAGGSNYGREEVDIYAPYRVLVGPDPENPTNEARLVSGTSFAAPFAAGVAAMIWAADPSLSANEVEDILFDTAHTSSDANVELYVNAFEAVRVALGDAPPSVIITQPSDGSSFPRGSQSVSFVADAIDIEDGTPSVEWTSSRDGVISNSPSFSTTMLSSGVHTITARATDTASQSTSTSITVTITNDAPMLTIDSPSNGASFFQSQSIPLSGSSFDINDLDPLPNSAVQWRIDGSFFSTGHNVTINANTLSVGSHTIRFSGSDGDLEGSQTISITVQSDPVNVPPSITITSPPNGFSEYVTDFDSARQQWYLNVTLSANTSDPEDGSLPASSISWEAEHQGGTHVEDLGTGNNKTGRLYSLQPFATTYTLRATVTDSGGESTSHEITVTVQILS